MGTLLTMPDPWSHALSQRYNSHRDKKGKPTPWAASSHLGMHRVFPHACGQHFFPWAKAALPYFAGKDAPPPPAGNPSCLKRNNPSYAKRHVATKLPVWNRVQWCPLISQRAWFCFLVQVGNTAICIRSAPLG